MGHGGRPSKAAPASRCGVQRGLGSGIWKDREGKEPWRWKEASGPEPESQQHHLHAPSWGDLMENLGSYCSRLAQDFVFLFEYACSWFNRVI